MVGFAGFEGAGEGRKKPGMDWFLTNSQKQAYNGDVLNDGPSVMCPRIVTEEDRQNRDQELLDTALELIRRENVTSLSMDKLVANVPYSKGTVYNHFCSKEDLLLGLCNCGMDIVADLFDRVADLKGRGRDRVFALAFAYLLYSQLYREQFFLHVQTKTPSLYEKGSPERIERNLSMEEYLLGHVLQAVEQAITEGDLQLRPGWDSMQVAFHLWASAFGAIALASVQARTPGPMQVELDREVFNQITLILDGLGWQPLSDQWVPNDMLARLERVFRKELQLLAEQGCCLCVPCSCGQEKEQ